jgi:hypothetical protein
MQKQRVVLALFAAAAFPATVRAGGEACPSTRQNRAPEKVLQDHREALSAGDVDRDVSCNYAPDAVVISDGGVDAGRDAIRTSLQTLVAATRGVAPTVTSQVVRPLADGGHMVRVLFSLERPCLDGVDTYLIQGGRIVAQTAHAFPGARCAPPRS